MSYNFFRKDVIISVIIIGAGFSTWAGYIYSEKFFWIASLVGMLCSYIAAKWYLKILKKAFDKGASKLIICLKGTLSAVIWGLVITAIIHSILIALFLWLFPNPKLVEGELPFTSILGIVLFVAGLLGIAAGSLFGVIFSLIYAFKVAGKNRESISVA